MYIHIYTHAVLWLESQCFLLPNSIPLWMQFVYPFTLWRTIQLLPVFGDWEWNFFKHPYVEHNIPFRLDKCRWVRWMVKGRSKWEGAGWCGKRVLSFSGHCQNWLQSDCLYFLHSQKQWSENSGCSASLAANDTVRSLEVSHSHRCKVLSHFCFGLQFPNKIWLKAPFHMVICHLYIVLGEVSRLFVNYLIML